ncbi:MAG: hypothetical protein VX776_08905 [Planctomycetota bacterium]|nr:hypothetical protein [Planctomycetota bacterium]
MRGIVASLPFALLTVFCWGFYGPALHAGKDAMDKNSWAQLLCVGISYFVVAVIVPFYVLKSKGEQGAWSAGGVKWGLGAGALGAFGALGIITALTQGGSPSYVMPIVFGCAPVVNTIVSMYMTKLFKEITPVFYLGILLVALGACGVFAFKPKDGAKHTTQINAELKTVSYQNETPTAQEPANGEQSKTNTASTSAGDSEKDGASASGEKENNYFLIIGGICLTVISWGAYGSVLHKSQHLMNGSRLRPLLCVGISYFILAVIIPLFIMYYSSGFPQDTEPSGWSFSLLAGVCGSVGALGIILSFTFGGKPVFVMPLVFGGAPVVNTITSVLVMSSVDSISPLFIVSLTTVILGAIVTLVSAPKPGKKPKPAEEEKPLWDQVREEHDTNVTSADSEDDVPEKEEQAPVDEAQPAEDLEEESAADKAESAENGGVEEDESEGLETDNHEDAPQED